MPPLGSSSSLINNFNSAVSSVLQYHLMLSLATSRMILLWRTHGVLIQIEGARAGRPRRVPSWDIYGRRFYTRFIPTEAMFGQGKKVFMNFFFRFDH